MQGLLITCQRRDLTHLVDVLGDWKEDGDATIVLYGYTNKLQDGFLLMHWTVPVTEDFQQKQLKEDVGIIDYVVYDIPSVLPHSDTPTL